MTVDESDKPRHIRISHPSMSLHALSNCRSRAVEMRRIMYTTNIIEGYHRQLRKATKGKSMFSNDEALLKRLYLATMEVTRKWTMRVADWGTILEQLWSSTSEIA